MFPTKNCLFDKLCVISLFVRDTHSIGDIEYVFLDLLCVNLMKYSFYSLDILTNLRHVRSFQILFLLHINVNTIRDRKNCGT